MVSHLVIRTSYGCPPQLADMFGRREWASVKRGEVLICAHFCLLAISDNIFRAVAKHLIRSRHIGMDHPTNQAMQLFASNELNNRCFEWKWMDGGGAGDGQMAFTNRTTHWAANVALNRNRRPNSRHRQLAPNSEHRYGEDHLQDILNCWRASPRLWP